MCNYLYKCMYRSNFFFKFAYTRIAKSPVFTHLAATMSGLPTIRAYNKEAILQHEFDSFQDIHSGCWFMSITTVSAFNLYVDTFSAIFMTCNVLYYMLLDSDVPAVKIGLAISQTMSLSGILPWGECRENLGIFLNQ